VLRLRLPPVAYFDEIPLIEIHFDSLLQKTQEALARILKYRNYAASLLFSENTLPDLDKSVKMKNYHNRENLYRNRDCFSRFSNSQ